VTERAIGCVIGWSFSAPFSSSFRWQHTYNWSAALVALRIHFGDRLPDTAI